MDEQTAAIIKKALNCLKARLEDYRTYAEYYEGRHNLAFASDKFNNAFGNLFRKFASNFCAPVVDVAVARLQVTGFSRETGEPKQPGAKQDPLAKEAWEIWQANRMDQRAGEVHTEALIAGDAYVIVWPDADSYPRLWPCVAEQMVVEYDPEVPGRILWAVKAWLLDGDDGTPEAGKCRLNVYLPDRIEKYVSQNTQQGALPDQATALVAHRPDGEKWPLFHDWGRVPVFHFPNAGRIGKRGKSELRDVKPLQDALNKAVTDMMVNSEFVAFPQRWATGLDVILDSNGRAIPPFTPGPDRLWAGGENVQFGEFSQGDLKQHLEVQEGFKLDIARVSQTPLHYLIPQSGQFPSGESLKTAEGPFVAKLESRQVSFGNVWEDVIRFALKMRKQAVDEVRLSTTWKNAAPRSESDQAQTGVLKQQIGVSKQQLLREMGYSEDEIATMVQEARDNAAAATAAFMGNIDKGRALSGD